MFVILQKYDFSSKSQPRAKSRTKWGGCLWYCKSTIFQANHNADLLGQQTLTDVCDTAKVRFFKQITTQTSLYNLEVLMFVILQKYDFSSKSQRISAFSVLLTDVCDTAKVRFFKQITTLSAKAVSRYGCLWYCKSTIFQANHNRTDKDIFGFPDVCDTAKVRFFKQITTFGIMVGEQ